MADRRDRRRFLVFCLDGAADWPCEVLGGKTPLAAAATPTLDRLAREGRTGRLDTIPKGCSPGSEVANLCILSYDPSVSNPGRGVLEGASMGIALAPDEIAFRTNVISLQGDAILDHSAGHITSEEAREAIEAADRSIAPRGARLYPGVSYRHLLTLAGGSVEVDCTPPHDILGKPYAEFLPRARTPAGEETARILRELIAASRPLFKEHPMNARRRAAGKRTADSLWPWAPGRNPAIENFERRFGVRGAVISPVDLVKGIGRLAGMTVIDVPGATGLPETNYEGKAEAAVAALDEHDFVYVHIEGTDEAGHMGDAALKTKAVEYCDRRLIGYALALLEKRGLLAATTIAVLPDHFTPCAIRTHDGTPVPFLIWGQGIAADGTQEYTEQACESGAFGLVRGVDFLPLLFGAYGDRGNSGLHAAMNCSARATSSAASSRVKRADGV